MDERNTYQIPQSQRGLDLGKYFAGLENMANQSNLIVTSDANLPISYVPNNEPDSDDQ